MRNIMDEEEEYIDINETYLVINQVRQVSFKVEFVDMKTIALRSIIFVTSPTSYSH